MKFEHWEGTGNSFLIGHDLNLKDLFRTEPAETVVTLCNGKYGLSSDGLLVLKKKSDDRFEWNFFNRDGTVGEMCGNAARCATEYVFRNGLSSSQKVFFETLSGLVSGQKRADGLIEISMSKQEHLGSVADYPCVDTGVPHVVVQQKEISAIDSDLCEKLRWDRRFVEKGSNVTFLSEREPYVLDSITFERGVEDFTLACGTGAVAASWVYLRAKGESDGEVRLHVPGGILAVRFSDQQAFLSGPVRRRFQLELTPTE